MPDDQQPSLENGSEESKHFFHRIPVTVEPIIFIYFFLYGFTDGVSTNILISKACTVIYGLQVDKCTDELKPEVEGLVQPYATKVLMLNSVLESVIMGVISLFVGSWSDVNGRKPFIVIPLAGFTLYYIAWYIFINLPAVSPLWVLVPTVCSSLSGGFASLFICVSCYISDVTKDNTRSFRMALISSTMTLGSLSGYLSSNLIYKTYGSESYTIIFSTAIGCSFIALTYSIFILPESKVSEEATAQCFFSCESIKETWGALFVHQRSKRILILMLEASIIVNYGIIFTGDRVYEYFALRKNFGWTLEQYNSYSAVISVVTALASTIGLYISSSIFQLHDLYIALFVALSSTVSCALLALSRTNIEFFLFSIVGCFGILVNPMLKSQISRTVEKSNWGKLFAFISTLEAFVPLLIVPLYRTVYNLFILTAPLYYLFLSASFWLLSSVFIFILLLLEAFGTRNYVELTINAE